MNLSGLWFSLVGIYCQTFWAFPNGVYLLPLMCHLLIDEFWRGSSFIPGLWCYVVHRARPLDWPPSNVPNSKSAFSNLILSPNFPPTFLLRRDVCCAMHFYLFSDFMVKSPERRVRYQLLCCLGCLHWHLNKVKFVSHTKKSPSISNGARNCIEYFAL